MTVSFDNGVMIKSRDVRCLTDQEVSDSHHCRHHTEPSSVAVVP